MAGVALSSNALSVTPGGDAVCTVTIRNTSSVVDSYEVTVLGDAAAWATVAPASVSLFPGADGTAEIHFRPPRSAGLRAGPVDFAVRVASAESGDSVVEEGVATVQPFSDVAAHITPRTRETKRRAKYVVTIDNKGNAPSSFAVLASDPDEALVFDTSPAELTVEPGESGSVSVVAAARKGFARGPAQHRPFQAVVSRRPAEATLPVQLDATLVQKAGMPAIVPALVAGAVILIAAAILIPGLTKDDGKSAPFTLTNAGGSTTSIVAASADAGGDDAGEAASEATDGGGAGATGGGAGTGGETATPSASPVGASGGTPGPGVVTTTTVSTEDEEVVTTVDEAPVTSTTAPATTIPAAPRQQFVGSWQHSVGCVTIKAGDTMVVTGALNGLDMSGTGSGADADDLDFVVKARRGAQDRYLLVDGVLHVSSSDGRGSLQLQRVKACG